MALQVSCKLSKKKPVSVVVVDNEETKGRTLHTSCSLRVASSVIIGQHGATVDTTQSTLNPNDRMIMLNAQKMNKTDEHTDQIDNLTENIGSGGSGTVFALRCKDGKIVAVKRVRNSNTESLLKILKETRILLLLLHLPSAYLCMPQGMYYWHNAMFFIFPRFDTSVHQLIAHCSSTPGNAYPTTFSELVYIIIRSVVCGLTAMHAEEFCHGDVKMQNVLVRQIDEQGVVCALTDFGQSIQVRNSGNEDHSDAVHVDMRSQDERLLFVEFPGVQFIEDMHALWMMFDRMMAKLRIEKPPPSAHAMLDTHPGIDIVVLLFAIRDKSTHADFRRIKSAVDVVQLMSRKVCDVNWRARLRAFV